MTANHAAAARRSGSWILLAVGASVAVIVMIKLPVVALVLLGPFAFYLATHPKTLAAITLLASIFVPTLINATGISGIDYVDELLIISTFIVAYTNAALGRRRIVWIPGGFWFVAFFLLASISALVTDVSVVLAAQDAFLLLKGVIFAAAVAQLTWTASDIQRAVTVGAWVIGAILVGAAINLAIPDVWVPLFAASELNARGEFGSIISFFGHPGSFGQVMALSTIAVLCYRQIVRKGTASMLLMLGSAAGALLSLRRKAIIGLVIVVGWFAFVRKPAMTILVVIIVTPIGWLLFGDELSAALGSVYDEYFVNPDGAARTVLYSSSVALANLHFPLGLGFSQFGTFIASENYSPVYHTLGFPSVWGLQPGGRFLTDTFWPAILGEGGWFGMISFFLGLTLLTLSALRLSRNAVEPLHRWVGVLAVVWSIEFLVESVASPVYVSPPTNLLLFSVLGLAAQLVQQTPRVSSSIADDRKRAGLI